MKVSEHCIFLKYYQTEITSDGKALYCRVACYRRLGAIVGKKGE